MEDSNQSLRAFGPADRVQSCNEETGGNAFEVSLKKRAKNRSKNSRFGVKNRGLGRPGGVRASPGGVARAANREKVARSHAFFFKGRSNAPVGARKYELFGG